MSQLPIASFTQVRAFARVLLTRHRGSIALMLAFYAVAAIAALVPAEVVGLLTNDATTHSLTAVRITDLVEVLAASSFGRRVGMEMLQSNVTK